jgi:MGT family glycosyltransferase
VVFGTLERAVLPLLNSARRQLGCSDVADARDMFTRASLMLITTAEPFEYPRTDWPEQTVLVGPCEWEPPIEAPAWLAGVTDPIVLVTTSSEAQDDGRLVQVALDALAGEPFHLVATVPAGIRERYRIPPNAHVEEFVPHSAVLGSAVVAVTHGGMGATQKALARGVPVCVVPFGRDQHEVAQRVRASGCGTTIKPNRLTPERLRAAILAARDLASGARRVGNDLASAGGPVAAADAIEQRLLRVTA